MKTFLHLLLVTAFLLTTQQIFAQQKPGTKIFRVYEDNDFINVFGQGTDKAYTNGTRFDFFYTKHKPSKFVIDRIMPKAGDSSADTYGWGLMQVMVTPNDITKTAYQPNDYPYSGALFATHTLYSYNPGEKYSFQTELVLGVMGPPSLAKQAQIFLHHLISYQRPMGWDNQLKADPLININFTAEKQLAAYKNHIEVIGGSQVFYGTMINGVTLYPLIRIGNLTPYFNGFMGQYSNNGRTSHKNRWHAYFILKPEVELMFSNALLEGGLFSNNGHPQNDKDNAAGPAYSLQKLVYSLNFGAVLTSGNFGISFIQNSVTPMIKGTYSHQVGNISLYFGW